MALDFDGPRALLPDELEASNRLFDLCFGHSFEEPGPGGDRAPALLPEVYVIASAGEPVSQIAVFHPRLEFPGGVLRIGSIGGVCTHPKARGHGLATRLLVHCARQLYAYRARLMLISGSRGLYTRVGCALAGRYAGFTIKPGQLGPAGPHISLRLPKPDDARFCYHLYQTEPARFTRAEEVFRQHFSTPRSGVAGEDWIVEMDGRPAAYLLLRLPWGDIGHPERGIRKVHEYAGSRQAIAGALSLALDRCDVREFQFPVPWQDTELIELLKGRQESIEWIALPEHTMRILDFPALMLDLDSYVRARLGPEVRERLRFFQSGPLLVGKEADTCTIQLGPSQLALDGAAMARLVMGSPIDQLEGRIDISEELIEVITALFPLPSFLPGLDYH